MKTIICCIALSWLYYAFVFCRNRWCTKLPETKIFENLFAVSIIGAITGFLAAVGISIIIPNKTHEENRLLVAVRSPDGKPGSFFSPASGILGTPAFRVFTRNVDGSIRSHIIPGDIYIVESSDLHDQAIWRTTGVNKDPSSPLYSWAMCIDGDWNIRHYLVLPDHSFAP